MLRLYTRENTQRKTREENSTKKRILARILTVVVAISLAISLSPSQAYGNMRSTFPSFNEERHLRQIYALY